MSTEQKITLIANDGISFMVDQGVSFKSLAIKEMCYNLDCMENVEICVAAANGRTLRKVLEYCRKHQNEVFEPRRVKEDQIIRLTKEQEMFLNIPYDFLLRVHKAAEYLKVPGLVAITTQKLGIAQNSAALREVFTLIDGMTMEEEQEIQQKLDWLTI